VKEEHSAKASHYSEIVSEGDLAALETIADRIADRTRIRLLKEPAPAMVMVRHVDPLDKTPFNLGEVYVTECEAEVDGVLGYGCCVGKEEARALFAAIIDAVLVDENSSVGENGKNGSGALATEVRAWLQEEAERIEERRSLERRAVSGTKVDFDVR
jgi:phosphonate C-P lyase system protein PhnG